MFSKLTALHNTAIPLASTPHSYVVTLTDISPSLLSVAQSTASSIFPPIPLQIAHAIDARNLRNEPSIFLPSQYDLSLCLGPLYHLLHLHERQTLIRDLIDTTTKSGYIICAFVTMVAHLRDLATRDPTRLAKEKDYYAEYLRTGHYTRNLKIGPDGKEEGMSMHHVKSVGEIKELFREFEARGEIKIEKIVSCESFLAGGLGKGLKELTNEEWEAWQKVLVHFATEVDDERDSVGGAGMGDHVLVVMKKLN